MSTVPIFSSKKTYNLRCLQRIFDRRAAGFDAVTFLLREISNRMNKRFDYIKVNPSRVLDSGCGTGDDLRNLNFRFPDARAFGIDLSGAMLARSGYNEVIQADFSLLPFASSTFDLIWSNLALHWHAHPNTVFQEWRRVLRVSGLLMFSTLGPNTICELRNSCFEADEAIGIMRSTTRVIDFIDMHNLGDMLLNSGFDIPVMDKELLTVIYTSPNLLIDDVKRWGAYPFYRESPLRTTRFFKSALETALNARRRPDGKIPLTFEIIYGHGWKALSHSINEENKIIQIKDIDKVSQSSGNISSSLYE
ncbi:MAG: methyltransferase domain-containing protein [Burkholderia sp.]|nr:methyltransferase domain-containing protein [Burkholderia sp.]